MVEFSQESLEQTATTEVANHSEQQDNQTLESLAAELAVQTAAARKTSGELLPILQHLDDLRHRLQQAHAYFTQAAQESFVTSYAGEWFLDNFYVVQQSLKQLAEDMPPKYYKQLPKITEGALAGYPRIYVLAHALGQFLDSRITTREQKLFIKAYQQHVLLSTGELWALPAMLRVVEIESLILGLDRLMEHTHIDMRALVPARVYATYGADIDSDVVVANCIVTLRAISVQNWQDFFEEVSHVEAVLRQDWTYGRMDFQTRNRYRSRIEHLAEHSPYSEEQIARAVLELAQRAVPHDADNGHLPAQERRAHVGYYLVDKGLAETKSVVQYRQPLHETLFGWLQTHALAVYLGSVFIITFLIVFALGRYAYHADGTFLQVLIVVLVTLIPAETFAVHFVNWTVTKLVAPKPLPKMDFSDGIPAGFQTMVVIPSLLTDTDEVDSLANQLEQHYLRNTDPHLYFAVLADYTDAAEETLPEDEALLQRATAHIQALNTRYSDSDYHPFYLFVRKRQWNPSEDKWMGYERKRGKLAEFNRLILEADAQTSYIAKIGDLSVLPKIRYIITLDSDTVLPRDGAQRLVGTFAHPLNQARFDDNSQKLTAGYTVLQPRVEILPTAANQTPFTRIFAGESGLDLYTLAVSDVYQDLFGEGIYVGKGIYDVAAFERSLAGRIPENALLSHDMFEGLHGRAALVTDVVLFEDYPAHYLAHVSRVHRWVRGDWQLLPWLRPRVPSADGGQVPNRFSALSLWKITDNLIRSLLQPSLLLIILLSWLLLPGSDFVWAVFALAVLMVPFYLGVINQVNANTLVRHAHLSLWRNFTLSLLRWALSVVFLPYEALIRLDAITTTLQRLRQRKHLLEWTTAANVMRMFRRGEQNTAWQRMMSSLVTVSVVAALAIVFRPISLFVSLPLVAIWFSGPFFVSYISQFVESKVETLTEQQLRQLRTLARRTWLFFEKFVGPDDNWLPPDHYQQAPIDKVGHYTSPTNIGLMLNSTLAAYDLGYIGLLELMTRLKLAFESISRLERYKGHLLNWYSTQSLQPLAPRYVSTVDNGNLAGTLVALQQGCKDLLNAPILRQQRWQGIVDTLAVLGEILDAIEKQQPNGAASEARQHLNAMREVVLAAQQTSGNWVDHLNQLSEQYWKNLSAAIVKLVQNASEGDVTLFRDLSMYVDRLQHDLNTVRRDLDLLLPWLTALQQAPSFFTESGSETAQAWYALQASIEKVPQFREAPAAYERVQANLQALQNTLGGHPTARAWCDKLAKSLTTAQSTIAEMLRMYKNIQHDIETELQLMDFGFLYDSERHLFRIGYNVDAEQLDGSYYDLLASEARLASFLAIARHDVPQKHWLHLGRPVTEINGVQTLLSWSGTAFEYMMPLLLTRDFKNTLLHQSYRAVVEHQIAYARQHHIPWGISESGYYAFDNHQNFQYQAFGLPAVAFKRGLDRDLVIAPYASVLALPVAPARVAENIDALVKIDALTSYGFVESIDFTAARLPLGKDHAFVQEYMAHHQGMIFLALTNFLHDNIMVKRFHSDPRVQSVELLLMEKIPAEPTLEQSSNDEDDTPAPLPTFTTYPWDVPVEPSYPQAHYLSNGRYAVMMTSGGGGYSQLNGRALTRWRADSTLDDWGQWLYIHDKTTGTLWSPTLQPMNASLESMRATFHLNRVEFQARADDISARLEVVVPPDDDLEIRRLSLTNHTEDARRLTISSYAEMVLTGQANDQRHQAFNKMFVESEYLPELKALLFRRRLRAADDKPLFVLHMLVLAKDADPSLHYETDRARFLGRNHTYRNPIAFINGAILGDTTGATLDPIMALAGTVDVPSHSTLELAYVTLAGDSLDTLMILARRYRSWEQIERAFNQSRYRSERELRQLGMNTDDVIRAQKLLSALLYPNPKFRAAPEILAANNKSQPGLWSFGISGDYPIILLQVNDEEQLDAVFECVQIHRYLHNRGFDSTLVILNQHDTGYMQEFYQQLHRLIIRAGGEMLINRHDGIFIVRAEQLNDADRTLLRTSARVLLDGAKGTLQEQIDAPPRSPVTLPAFIPSITPDEVQDTSAPLARPTGLRFDNGVGGFTADGREYVMYVDRERTTPAPWVNVIANAKAGFTVSEAGGGFTWAYNSGEHRLTTWRNDPVTDLPSEALYLRDEESAAIWSPTPMPAGTQQPYLVRHGAGYSVIEHQSHGLTQTVSYYMAADDPVKFVRVRLKNTATRPRRVTVTYYLEWVLGPTRDMTQQYLTPEFDQASQTLLVRNPYSIDFGGNYAFVTADRVFHGMTTDRTEFLGRMGSLASPAALRRLGLNNTVRAGIDPCAVVQLHVDLPVGGEDEVCFIVGTGESRPAALELSQQYRAKDAIEQARRTTTENWRNLLDSIIVRTPNESMNLLLPWLLYQALSCRILGRSALYQSSGAYGFRDQLQDVLALVHVRPDLAREHILRAARHQFEAGDVLHWWHPPLGRGVRTRFSDDLVWLPYVVTYYIEATKDETLLHALEPFVRGELLRDGEEERYGLFEKTTETYSIYEHCTRALNQAYMLGDHHLPLMRAGDWNDGMNRVGIEGRGESVWMGWFLYATMNRFKELSKVMGDDAQVETFESRLQELKGALETAAWDGEWYLRAYYDNGAPLGSQQSDECQIDSLPQSWGVLSGAADRARAEAGMQAVQEKLVHFDDMLIQLFTPPFNHTRHDPGYIKGYPPGIRENGGQYTHAALWVVWAFAKMGKGDVAQSLFDLLNPIQHSDTPDKMQTYAVEPYVIAADVYSVPPHRGRGGWTWYTGSSGWMYRLGIEAILGMYREGDQLRIDPSITHEWDSYEIDYRYGKTTYSIVINNPDHVQRGVREIRLDGERLSANVVPLSDDGKPHSVNVTLGQPT